MRAFLFGMALLMIGLPNAAAAGTETDKAKAAMKQAAMKQGAIVGAEISAIANQLSLHPATAKDFSKVSGEYCFFGGWDGHHTHYAIDPTKTGEDVVDFVDARPLIKAGLNVNDLLMLPGPLGSMTSKQWYFLPAGEFEPHHGKKAPFALLVRAINIK